MLLFEPYFSEILGDAYISLKNANRHAEPKFCSNPLHTHILQDYCW
jgi:hypothetical protein